MPTFRTMNISIYTEDLERLDRLVAALREREPHPRRRGRELLVSRSMVIRLLLQTVDLDALAPATPAASAEPSASPPARAARPTTSRQRAAPKSHAKFATRAPAIAELLGP